ncbi:MAG: helix-turn-helix transcriptional regulator [Rhodopirellula sp.]|nr:helix-turn-helix transcriptional regulator [Rhodopirellula sp.]
MVKAGAADACDMGSLLRGEISRRRLSQYRIAKDTGIKQPSLSRFLNGGSLKLETAGTLADYLGFELVPKVDGPKASPSNEASSSGKSNRRRKGRHSLPNHPKRQKRKVRQVGTAG